MRWKEGEGEGKSTHRDKGCCGENIHHHTILPNFIAHGVLHHARLNAIDGKRIGLVERDLILVKDHLLEFLLPVRSARGFRVSGVLGSRV